MHFLNDINFLAVLVAAVVAFALGSGCFTTVRYTSRTFRQ
jgi:hypothetical protein